MMKKTTLVSTALFVILMLAFGSVAHAQLRKDQGNNDELSGPIVKKEDPSEGANLGNLFNMQMDHSYSMMFSSYGGQMHNLNAYTNTMRFFFSDKLTGRLDLSLLHSPFGNSFMSNGSNNGLDAQFLIRNAELNYEISDKSNIRIQFQQVPAGYGMNPWSSGFYQNPFNSPFQDRNF